MIDFVILNEKFQYYYNSAWHDITDCADNQWYHIEIAFECTTGSYRGLSQYKFKVWIDGTEYGEYGFWHNKPSAGSIQFMGGSNLAKNLYVDAVGYSWDPDYNIGDNLNEGLLLSYENSTNLDWKGYSLDGAANKTILGNATIPMPSDGLHNIQTYGNDTFGTMYESNMRYFSVDTTPYIDISTPENKTYTEPDSGYYPATYGFENDRVGNDPFGWNIISEIGDIRVASYVAGHYKVYEDFHNGTGSALATHSLSKNQVNGTVELWVRLTDTGNQRFTFRITDSIDNEAIIFPWNGKWGYYDTTYKQMTTTVSANKWYHFRIQFNCAIDRYYVWIDGVSQDGGSGLDLRGSPVSMKEISCNSYSTSYATYTSYVDAISCSWDSNIGDNLNDGLLLSYENTTNLEWQGYSLDGADNKTILGNTTIPMPSEGSHQIQVFGNNSIGTRYESAVRHFSVDTTPPEISITYPLVAQEFSAPPSYILSITEDNVAAIWYTLNGGSNNPISSETGVIDSIVWNSLANGPITIRFYVRDIADREAFEEVIVVKIAAEVPPPGIPGYDLYLLIGALGIISALIIRKRVKS